MFGPEYTHKVYMRTTNITVSDLFSIGVPTHVKSSVISIGEDITSGYVVSSICASGDRNYFGSKCRSGSKSTSHSDMGRSIWGT